MCLKAGAAISVFPSSLVIGTSDPCGERVISLVVRVRRELMSMQHNFRFGKRRDKGAHSSTVTSKCGVGSAKYLMDIESICVGEGCFEEFPRHLEPNKTQIRRWRERGIGESIDIKGELCPYMAGGALAIRDRGP